MSKRKTSFTDTSLIHIGWREWIYLPLHKNFAIKAKIDSGAQSSSIHATHLVKYVKNGQDRIKFRIYQSKKCLHLDKVLLNYKKVTNSFGDSEIRPVIEMKIKLGNSSWKTQITLSRRSGLSYSMLIGRNSLKKKHIIHSHKSYLTGINGKNYK